MKFFLDFRFCYVPTVAAAEEEATSATNAEAPLISRKSDARHSRLGSRSVIQWRPALSAIAENGVVSFADGQNERKTLKNDKKARTKGKSMLKGRIRYSHNNDNKHSYNRDDTIRVVIPAFSPTPFAL